MAAAVFGNVGGLLVFQVGAEDAEFLAAQLGGYVQQRDLLTLPKHTAYARLLIDGLPGRPFSMRTLQSNVPQSSQNPEVIRRRSRRRYGQAGGAGTLLGAD